MSVDAAAVTPGCVLAPVTEVVAKRCVWCGTALGKGLRRWCSKACVDLFVDNHEWTAARYAAIRRASILREGGAILATYCDQCRRRCNVMVERRPGWPRRVEQASAAEVNHVEPRVGAGYDKGCWNHQTNLQVLCHACHVLETARQGRERKAADWRAMGWTWAQAERFIETGARPGLPAFGPAEAEPLPLWPAA